MRNLRKITVLSVMALFLSISFASADTPHSAELTRPIQLGTSGGNIYDVSRAYCCTGTLGAVVRDSAGIQYILSNNHVLARTNKARAGEPIIQPGLGDLFCAQDFGNAVANLSRFVPISFKRGTRNTVDAAIAVAQNGKVNTTGSILDIGTISSQIVAPALNMPVKKSGRTTGFTTGTIKAVNVTLDIYYNKSCGVGAQKARFVNQIVIGGSGFSAGGDSGAVIVENCSANPRAVALLFAGSSTSTIANPISNVLNSLNVSMVGASNFCQATAAATAALSEAFEMSRKPDDHANSRAIEAATRVKEKHEHAVMGVSGVLGMGVGVSSTNPDEVVIKVFVSKDRAPGARHNIPGHLDGFNVEIEETDEFKAF